MQRSRIFFGLVIVLMLMLISPLLIGLWLQHQYYQRIDFYKTSNGIGIDIKHYERHWFSSKVSILINIPTHSFSSLLSAYSDEVPNGIELMVDQTIKHGPLIFNLSKESPFKIGLVAMNTSITFPSATKKLLHQMGFNQLSVRRDNILFKLTDNIDHQISLGVLQWNNNDNSQSIGFSRFDLASVMDRNAQRVKGDAGMQDFFYSLQNGKFTLPHAAVRFEVMKVLGLWLGNTDLSAAALQWDDVDGTSYLLSGLHATNSMNLSGDTLLINQNLSINKLQLNDEADGPLSLGLTVTGLNPAALAEIIAAYQKVIREGEQYQEQLKTKLSILVPTIFKPGAAVTLNSLSVLTAEGHLQAQGELKWPAAMGEPPSDMSEFYTDSSLNLTLNFSKPLLNKMIDLSIELFYAHDLSADERSTLLALQSDVNTAFQQNAIFIDEMANQGLLPQNVKTALFQLQKEIGDADLYNDMVKNLFLDKQISLETAYRLYYQFGQLLYLAHQLENKWAEHKDSIKKNLLATFSGWVKKGYVRTVQDDYVILLTREQGMIKMNGKEIKTEDKP